MKYILLLLMVTILGACATPRSTADAMLKQGDIVPAYNYYISSGQTSDGRLSLVKDIKSSHAYSSEKFYQGILEYIKKTYMGQQIEFLSAAKLVKLALSDGLLTTQQAESLRGELLYSIEMTSAKYPGAVSSELIAHEFPELGDPRYKAKIYISKISEIKGNKASNLAMLGGIFSVERQAKDDNLTFALKDICRDLSAKELAGLTINADPISFSTLSNLLHSSILLKDKEFDARVRMLLYRVNFSARDLKSPELEFFDPDFARIEAARKTITINLSIKPDDGYLQEEIEKELKIRNDWIGFDQNSRNLMTIAKQRYIENQGSSLNSTEIVSDPDFSVLLFIPKNASVLFDYVTSEYRIDYAIELNFPFGLDKKLVRGTESQKRVECHNIRYQNVFGGVGAIPGYPNSRVESFCNSSKQFNIDKIRGIIASKIVSEMNTQFSKRQ